MTGRLQLAQRYWHTARHLRLPQIAARLRLRASAVVRESFPEVSRRRYVHRLSMAGLEFPREWRVVVKSAAALRRDLSSAVIQGLEDRAAAIGRGQFRFLNVDGRLGWPIDWSAPGHSRLWRYHLQYFDDLPEVAVLGNASWPLVRSLMVQWIGANTFGSPTCQDAWHPYVVSVRLVNWMIALATCGVGPADVPADVRESLGIQCLFVCRHLETDVGGNHLLKNLKSLVIAGCFCDGPLAETWRREGVTRFCDAVEAQLLEDGGHYERSPMYHALVMMDLLEVMAFVSAREGGVPGRLAVLLRHMDAFLTTVIHPDGEIALFNDSAFLGAPRPAALHACTRLLTGADVSGDLTLRHRILTAGLSVPVPGSEAARAKSPPVAAGRSICCDTVASSGYLTLASADRRRFLIADAGAVCPDNLPAHAHADLLSYELSLDGRRVIVDAGVGEYAAGRWRDYDRSTRAHNTVVVDGAEQSDCWGSFRVAARARPKDVRAVAEPRIVGFSAAHDGYTRLRRPVVHRRRVAFVDDQYWIVVDDLEGSEVHRWESYVHFHPDADVERISPSAVAVRCGSAGLQIAWFGSLTADIVRGAGDPIQGWHAPEFGRREPAQTLVLSGQGSLPAQFGYALVPQTTPGSPSVAVWDGAGVCAVSIGDARFDVDLSGSPWRVTGPALAACEPAGARTPSPSASSR